MRRFRWRGSERRRGGEGAWASRPSSDRRPAEVPSADARDKMSRQGSIPGQGWHRRVGDLARAISPAQTATRKGDVARHTRPEGPVGLAGPRAHGSIRAGGLHRHFFRAATLSHELPCIFEGRHSSLRCGAIRPGTAVPRPRADEAAGEPLATGRARRPHGPARPSPRRAAPRPRGHGTAARQPGGGARRQALLAADMRQTCRVDSNRFSRSC